MYVRLALRLRHILNRKFLSSTKCLRLAISHFNGSVWGKWVKWREKVETVLFVSHNRGSISRLCQTGIMLREGNLALPTSINAEVCRWQTRA